MYSPFKNRSWAERSYGSRGFTLTELLAVVFILGLLAAIVGNTAVEYLEKARLVRCMAELRGLQAAVETISDGGKNMPDGRTFWDRCWPDGKKRGPYYYLVDGDPNKGHGNDLDGVDEENPGNSKKDKVDIKYVILCQHNHKHLGKYVYITDEGPPVIATDETDPGYTKFIKYEFGGPGGGNDK